ncbi:MAG: formylglycine-generating enzyme family protein [Candidatus Omnitrophota bacterium]
MGIIFCMFALATPLIAQEMNVPLGCKAVPGAKAGDGCYADRVIHEKTGIELVLIPSGSFNMDTAGWTKGTRKTVTVTLAKPFYMGATTVTNKQYKQFVSSSGYDGTVDCDPGYDLYLRHLRVPPVSIMPSGDNYPIVWVSWKNAKAFCGWAGDLDLPSESEWEYACRAGTKGLFNFGDDKKDLDKYAWTQWNSKFSTQPVGQLMPNSWGLYDMHGNVWEWCLDDELPRDLAPPADGSAYVADKSGFKGLNTHPFPVIEGTMTKDLRGGSWSSTLCYAVSSFERFNASPVMAANDFGFRVVLRLK